MIQEDILLAALEKAIFVENLSFENVMNKFSGKIDKYEIIDLWEKIKKDRIYQQKILKIKKELNNLIKDKKLLKRLKSVEKRELSLEKKLQLAEGELKVLYQKRSKLWEEIEKLRGEREQLKREKERLQPKLEEQFIKKMLNYFIECLDMIFLKYLKYLKRDYRISFLCDEELRDLEDIIIKAKFGEDFLIFSQKNPRILNDDSRDFREEERAINKIINKIINNFVKDIKTEIMQHKEQYEKYYLEEYKKEY